MKKTNVSYLTKLFLQEEERDYIKDLVIQVESIKRNTQIVISDSVVLEVANTCLETIYHILESIIYTEYASFIRRGILNKDSKLITVARLIIKNRSLLRQKYPHLNGAVKNEIYKNKCHVLNLITTLYSNKESLCKLNAPLINGAFVIEKVLFVGDPHQTKARGAILTINGFKIVYKPRDLSPEEFLNKIASKYNIGTAKTICNKNEGFQEYIKQTQYKYCELNFQIGRVMALAYILMLKDLHCNNLVFQNDKLFVIDAECLFSVRIDPFTLELYSDNSIFDYLIIPFYDRYKNFNTQKYSILRKLLDSIDKPDINKIRAEVKSSVLDSFMMIVSTKAELSNELKKHKVKKIRILFRSTNFYYNLLKDLTHPRLQMMSKFSIIRYLYTKLGIGKVYRKIIKLEIKYLLNGCFPYFCYSFKNEYITDGYGNKIKKTSSSEIINIIASNIHNLNKDAIETYIDIFDMFFDIEEQNTGMQHA